jgi:hypothetical protein
MYGHKCPASFFLLTRLLVLNHSTHTSTHCPPPPSHPITGPRPGARAAERGVRRAEGADGAARERSRHVGCGPLPLVPLLLQRPLLPGAVQEGGAFGLG